MWKETILLLEQNKDGIMTKIKRVQLVQGGEGDYINKNKARYTATLVACGWAGAVLEKVTRASGQEPYAQKAQKRQKSNSRKSVRWSAVPVAPM